MNELKLRKRYARAESFQTYISALDELETRIEKDGGKKKFLNKLNNIPSGRDIEANYWRHIGTELPHVLKDILPDFFQLKDYSNTRWKSLKIVDAIPILKIAVNYFHQHDLDDSRIQYFIQVLKQKEKMLKSFNKYKSYDYSDDILEHSRVLESERNREKEDDIRRKKRDDLKEYSKAKRFLNEINLAHEVVNNYEETHGKDVALTKVW